MKVRFAASARDQFLAAIAYIRRDKPGAAVHFRKRAEACLTRLQRFPASGRVIAEFPELPYRELVVPPYRFFYRVKGDTVWIVAVRHSAQIPDVSAP